MTAEIAVMNQSAVALAADSAATRSEAKIFTANKIFALSKYHPVGVMIYGTSACMRVPWETIIKEFRAGLGNEDYPTIHAYGEAFFAFIARNRRLFPETQQQQFAYDYAAEKFERIRQTVEEEVREKIANKGSVSLVDVGKITAGVIKARSDFWKERPRRRGLPRDVKRRTRERYGDQIRMAREDVFDQLPLTGRLRETLMMVTLDSWSRQPVSGELQSGIVLAGFGKDDMFPSLVGYVVDGVLLNRPIHWQEREIALNHKERAAIVPFAQDDVMRLFVEGVTPDYEAFVEAYFRQIVSGLTEMVNKELGEESATAKLRTRLEENRDALIGTLAQKWSEKRHSLYINPMLSIVGSLPMDELATLAESLVNLTSLRRRVSLDHESVGGPIDVAVISRGDGLVWIKRKHYFPGELNHQFSANYFRR